jgi:hypothetical protein
MCQQFLHEDVVFLQYLVGNGKRMAEYLRRSVTKLTFFLAERESVSVGVFPLGRPNLGIHTKLIQDPHVLGYDMFTKWLLMF